MFSSYRICNADCGREGFVNGQRGGEGETLPNGLRIEEIIGDGAILSWNGTRFLVPIQ